MTVYVVIGGDYGCGVSWRSDADKRLALASPDLLAALEEISEKVTDSRVNVLDIYDIAMCAIRKAKPE